MTIRGENRPYTDEELEILKLTNDEQIAYDEYQQSLKKQRVKKKKKNKLAKKARKRNR